MDQALKDVLLKHYQRYPEMKIEDYVKLIYQQTFGPAHFSKKADYVHTLSYLIKELNDCKLTYHSPMVESIGNNYFRISLQAICSNEISSHEMTEIFIKSMDKTLELTDALKQSFLKKLETLLKLIEQNEMSLNYEDCFQWIQNYVKSGIKPTHHSENYRHIYHPMYRVVHYDFLPQNLYDKIR